MVKAFTPNKRKGLESMKAGVVCPRALGYFKLDFRYVE